MSELGTEGLSGPVGAMPAAAGYLIQAVLVPQAEGYATVDVRIQGEWITAIAPKLEPAGVVIDGRDKLLLPGFVNGHTHSSQIWQRGLIRPLPLELWLADVFDTSPALGLEDLYLGALTTGVETLMSGGTCLMDHVLLVAGHEVESVAAISKAYQELGIRAFIAPLLMDEPFVAGLPQGRSLPHVPYPRSAADHLAVMETLIAQFHQPERGLQIAVGPTGFHRCSDELLAGCAALSDRYDLCRHTHLLETKAQQKLAFEKYGQSAVAHLKHLGFLDHRTSLAHGVWLNDADLQAIAETRSTLVHNPLSNLRLGSGIAPVLKALQMGVNVAFGCDGAASNDAQNLLEAIKIGTILHTVTDPDYEHWLTPQQAIAMASLGGAKGVNLENQVGSLAVGKKADLVLYDLAHPSMLPQTDPMQLLVLGRPTQVVAAAWVNGRQIIANGQIQTVDDSRLYQSLLDRSRHARSPQRPTMAQVEPHYRTLLDTVLKRSL